MALAVSYTNESMQSQVRADSCIERAGYHIYHYYFGLPVSLTSAFLRLRTASTAIPQGYARFTTGSPLKRRAHKMLF